MTIIECRDSALGLNEAIPFLYAAFQAAVSSVTKPIRVKGVPFKLDDSSLPDEFRQVSDRDEIVHLVILTEPNSARFLSNHLPKSFDMVVPVADTCRGKARGLDHLTVRADVLIPAVTPTCLDRLLDQIEPMIARLRVVLPTLSQNAAPEA